MIKWGLMVMLVAMAGADMWIPVANILLEYDHWSPVTSDWHAAGLPNIKPVQRDVPGYGNQVCTEISWQYTDFPWTVYDNPTGENWWRPQSADEGRCFYIAMQTGWIRAWEYPFAPAPQYKILISYYDYAAVSYAGYYSFCTPVEPASIGSVKAIYR